MPSASLEDRQLLRRHGAVCTDNASSSQWTRREDIRAVLPQCSELRIKTIIKSCTFNVMASRLRLRWPQRVQLAFFVALCLVLCLFHLLYLSAQVTREAHQTAASSQASTPPLHFRPWSVLVQHADVVARFRAPARQPCGLFSLFACPTNPIATNLPLPSNVHLPSWTLHVVDPRCETCLDRKTYGDAFQGSSLLSDRHHPHSQQQQEQQTITRRNGAVFASTAAPLGRIGPMLLAISSNTNDISVLTELPKWAWVPVTRGADTASDAGARTRRSYVAVMGIPSKGQPERASLREAQRQTWMSYTAVARAANGFTGALLPLYIFAGMEADRAGTTFASTGTTTTSTTVASKAYNTKSNAARTTRFAVSQDAPVNLLNPSLEISQLTPTVEELTTVSAVRHATQITTARELHGSSTDKRSRSSQTSTAASKQVREAAGRASYTIPRVVLRDGWQTGKTPHDSPCMSVQRRATTEAHDALVHVATTLRLPVTPAFVQPAQFICQVFAALWQEALKHRNVVWIDMMTDRRPASDKQIGEDRKWGLAVEVGMSQKLILWLSYAYHAFPDVPFIIKGDDDTYLKVPQFLSDVYYLAEHNGSATLSRADPRLPLPNRHLTARDTICTYWGSTRAIKGKRFNAGMLFLLHRYLVQAVLEPPSLSPTQDPRTALFTVNGSQSEHVWLAAHDFSRNFTSNYIRLQYYNEDVLLGFLLHERQPRAQELCVHHRMFYVKETLHRFHDLRVGRVSDVTPSSVVVHRCQATDLRFLHYYVTHEHRLRAGQNTSSAEQAESRARREATAWVAQQKMLMPSLTTWDRLPSTRWVTGDTASAPLLTTPPHMVVPEDDVAVYEHQYVVFQQPQFHVYDGYVSFP